MNKVLVFDMDGTIADFYGVDGWLDYLMAEDARPYTTARPFYNMWAMMEVLNELKNDGWRVVVTTWLAKDATKKFDKAVRKAKLEWLEKFGFPYDELHMVKYGTTKANCTRKLGGYQILIDDNAKVRKGWTLGTTFDANKNVYEFLKNLRFGG
jgi:hypothetical protein